MRVKNTLGLLILAFLFTTAVSVAVALQEGVDYVWVDLGEVNDEHGLTHNDANVNDGDFEIETIGGRECRKSPGDRGDIVYYMYFTVTDDDFLASICDAPEAWVVMVYYDSDQVAGRAVNCNYGSGGNPWQETPADSNFSVGGTMEWLVHVWRLEAPCFEHAQQGVADFRVCSRHAPFWIDRVAVSLSPSEPGDTWPFIVAVEPKMKLATTWGAIKK